MNGFVTKVLIETYWNVNEDVQLFMKRLRKGINRNILECKFHHRRIYRVYRICINRNILECKCALPQPQKGEDVTVLIETYWNVNGNIRFCYYLQPLVLIETYWNVNLKSRKT